jgi:hypothetical protein
MIECLFVIASAATLCGQSSTTQAPQQVRAFRYIFDRLESSQLSATTYQKHLSDLVYRLKLSSSEQSALEAAAAQYSAQKAALSQANGYFDRLAQVASAASDTFLSDLSPSRAAAVVQMLTTPAAALSVSRAQQQARTTP